MNNKELTELKREFIEVIRKNTSFDGLSLHTENVWKWLEPHLKSNDEIKREAVEGFAHYVVNVGVGTGLILEENRESALASLLEGVGNYLTQKETNE